MPKILCKIEEKAQEGGCPQGLQICCVSCISKCDLICDDVNDLGCQYKQRSEGVEMQKRS